MHLATVRDAVESYLSKNVHLPIWTPQKGSQAMRDHIAALQIPQLSRSSAISFPSLLLHNLGQTPHDKSLDDRIDKLFNMSDAMYEYKFSFAPNDLIIMP
jgi:hypothetical protein